MNRSALLHSRVRHVPAAAFACLLLSFSPGLAAALDPQPRADTAASLPLPVVVGDLQISAAWARATVGSTPVAAAYFTIINRGTVADTLLGAASPVAAHATLHQTVQANGMAHMRPAGQRGIAPGQRLKVEPGSLHLMLDGLKHPLAAGARIPVVLEFRRAGSVSVEVQVIALTAAAPGNIPAQPSMQHGHMAR